MLGSTPHYRTRSVASTHMHCCSLLPITLQVMDYGHWRNVAYEPKPKKQLNKWHQPGSPHLNMSVVSSATMRFQRAELWRQSTTKRLWDFTAITLWKHLHFTIYSLTSELQDSAWKTLKHPPCCPHISPCDFELFLKIKASTCTIWWHSGQSVRDTNKNWPGDGIHRLLEI
jgi:hypothetical protein